MSNLLFIICNEIIIIIIDDSIKGCVCERERVLDFDECKQQQKLLHNQIVMHNRFSTVN